MSYFQVQCERCGAVYRTGMVGRQMIGGHQCTAPTPPPGCIVSSFSSAVCKRGTKCCTVTHPDKSEPDA